MSIYIKEEKPLLYHLEMENCHRKTELNCAEEVTSRWSEDKFWNLVYIVSGADELLSWEREYRWYDPYSV